MTDPGDCIANIALPATGFRATGPARMPPIWILIPAIFAMECSNTRPLPGRPNRSRKICCTLCIAAFPARPCRRSAKLPDEQIESLVEYVKYLSIRGETELYLLQTVVDKHAALPLDQGKVLAEGVRPSTMSWDQAADMAVVPPATLRSDTLEQLSVSIDRGRELFRTMGGQCFLCHGWTGKGDGQHTDFYDDWNKRKIADTPEQTQELALHFQLPVQSLPAQKSDRGRFPRRRPADRPLPADFSGHQRHAHARRRSGPGPKGRTFARGHLARRKLRSLIEQGQRGFGIRDLKDESYSSFSPGACSGSLRKK